MADHPVVLGWIESGVEAVERAVTVLIPGLGTGVGVPNRSVRTDGGGPYRGKAAVDGPVGMDCVAVVVIGRGIRLDCR